MPLTHQYERECIRVIPSTEAINHDEIYPNVASLHNLEPSQRDDVDGLGNKIVSSILSSNRIRIECLALSEGEDQPIKLLYTADNDLNILERRLKDIYPDSFTVERTELDPVQKLVRPLEFEPQDFIDHLEHGNLRASVDELAVDDEESSDPPPLPPGAEQPSDTAPQPDGGDGLGINQVDTDQNGLEDLFDEPDTPEELAESESPDQMGEHSASRRVEEPNDDTTFSVDEGIVKIDPVSEYPRGEDPLTDIERPTVTPDGKILARPDPDGEIAPYAIRWLAKRDRDDDWMTAAKTSTDIPDAYNHWRKEDDVDFNPKPLVSLLDELVDASIPSAFQVVFDPKPNWGGEADFKMKWLKNGRDTWTYKLFGHEKEEPEESELERVDLIKAKSKKNSFRVNARLLSVHTPQSIGTEEQPDAVESHTDPTFVPDFHENLKSLLTPINGRFYEFNGTRLKRDARKLTRKDSPAFQEWQRFLKREVTSHSRESSFVSVSAFNRTDPELILGPRPLADLIIVPSAATLPGDLFRSSEAKHQDRQPLVSPPPSVIEQFSDGATIGYPYDTDGTVRDRPIGIPQRLLNQHFGIFASSGSGKSIKLTNMLLSLHENVPGPEILFEPKGDRMCYKYLQTYYNRYGDLDDIYYFEVPEQMPVVSFFDIRPSIASGRDRSEAIQDRISHFHSIMEIVMGEESYNAAYRAKQIIAFLIKAEFDEQYGQDAFTIDDLYDTATDLYRFQTIPQASPAVEKGLAKIVPEENESDDGFEATMSAVFTRLDKLRENSHVYHMLNQCPEWDSDHQQYIDECLHFRELVAEDVQILFDLGRLRKQTQRAFTLILLSSLWDDIQWRSRAQGSTETQVNLIIEEAAQIASKPLVYEQLIPQSRAFGLSMGLVMQFPSQVKDVGGRRPYNEIMNNIQNKIYGKIEKPDDRLDEAISVDEILPEEVANKLKHMKPGEWIADLSARFGDEVTTPFSIKALDIPSGHPEGDEPLQNRPEFSRHYQFAIEHTIQQFGTERSTVPDLFLDVEPDEPEADDDQIKPVPPNRFDNREEIDEAFHSRASPSQPTSPPESESRRSQTPADSSAGDGENGSQSPDSSTLRTFADQHCDSCGEFMPSNADLCADCRPDQREQGLDEPAADHDEVSDPANGPSISSMPASDIESVDRDIPDYDSDEIDDLFDDSTSADNEVEAESPETSSDDTLESSVASGEPVAEPPSDSQNGTSPTDNAQPSRSEPDGLNSSKSSSIDLENAEIQTLDDVTNLAREINQQLDDEERIAKLGQLQLKASETVMDIPISELKEIGTSESESVADPDGQNQSKEDTDATVPETDQYEADGRCTNCGQFINYGKQYCDDCRQESDTDSSDSEESSLDDIPAYAAPVTDAEREAYGLSSADIQFLTLVADAYHRRLEDYTLLDSMTEIRDRAGNPDIDHLMEVGLIEKANSRRTYYNLTPEAWDLIEESPHSAGDWREKILHRVGVVITEKLLQSRDDVETVEPYYQVDAETVLDIAAFDEDGDLCHAGEIEMFSWNKEAVVEDYKKLAANDATSIWVTENRKSLSKVLNDLLEHDCIPDRIDFSTDETISELNSSLTPSIDGMNEVYTFTKGRERIDGGDE